MFEGVFESFVNSERCKTINTPLIYHDGLRALLIQKDVKRKIWKKTRKTCLRALLIQKDVKPASRYSRLDSSLRALLIQKDVKRY